jgi:serine/threonine protein phosphatase PrpC
MMRVVVGGLTDIGMVREENQDSLGDFEPEASARTLGRLLIVADGVGGHRGGRVASGMAVNALADAYYDVSEDETLPAGSTPTIEDRLARSFRVANDRIFAQAQRDPSVHGMASTCTALVLYAGRIFVAHLGDSRAYLVRDGRIRQLTTDHSLVQERVDAGLLTPEEARMHADRNIITRSLGFEPDIEPEVLRPPLAAQPGDRYVLSTDGLHGVVPDDAIVEAVMRFDPSEAGRRLVEAANSSGGPDNVTVQVLRIDET